MVLAWTGRQDAQGFLCAPSRGLPSRLPSLRKSTWSDVLSAGSRRFCESLEGIPCPTCDPLRRAQAFAVRGNESACGRENLRVVRKWPRPGPALSGGRVTAEVRIRRRLREPRWDG